MLHKKYNGLIKEIVKESFVKDYSGNPIVYYTSSDTEAEQMISTLLAKNPVRGLYDLKNKLYIFGDAYNIIHVELIEKLKLYGKTNYSYPILDEEIYEYLDKYCAMFKIIDENEYKSFTRSDGYRYAYIGKFKNNQYIIFRNNELSYNAPDELKKIQKVPLFKNIQFKKYDIRSIGLNSKEQLPQKIVNESIKQSNLNDDFWKWFGNSKMKKKNGEPIVFYHTTYNDFNVFEPIIFKNRETVVDYKNGREQYYFTPYKDWANNFGKEEFNKKQRKNIKILPVYLKCENPLIVLPLFKTFNQWLDWFHTKNINVSIEDLLIMANGVNYFDETYIKNRFGENNEKSINFWINTIKSSLEKDIIPFWQLIYHDTNKLKHLLNNAGYDSIIIRDTKRNTVNNLSVIVFEPNQIKSVDNNGEWNPNSKNIMETYDYIDDIEVLLNPTKKELNDFIERDRWYRILLSETGFAIWSADTPLLHTDVEDEYDIQNAEHLFAYNGNVYFQDYNLISDDYDEREKKWYISSAQELDNNKILRNYFPKMNMKQTTIDMFDGKKVLDESSIKLKENKINEVKILNEVFSMDSFNKKQLEALAQKVIDDMEHNSYITEDNDFETYVDPLNLPESVMDMIAAYWGRPKDDLTVPEILGSPYSKKYLVKEIILEFKDTYHFIESLGEPLTLYRYLNLYYEKPDNIEHNRLGDTMLQHILSKPNIHLGLSWTPYFSKAEDFGDDNHDLHDGIIMEIKCPRNAINLANTLILRNPYTFYNFENEIELIKSAPILLNKIYKLDEKGGWKYMNINKQYRA